MSITAQRIKCPIILTVVRSERRGQQRLLPYLFTVVNILDEFSQPVFPAFLNEVDVETIQEQIDQLNDIDNVSVDILKRIGKTLWTLIPKEISSYLSQLEQKFALQIRLATNDSSLPWEIICDEEGFWSVRYSMGRILGLAHQGLSSPPVPGGIRHNKPSVLLIYDPDSSLDSAFEEGEKLLVLLNRDFHVEPLKQNEATVGAVFQAFASNEHDIIHFAGHAKVGKRSALVCHNGTLLEANTIHNLSLKRRPVVFANACATATKSTFYGGASSSLAEAFVGAGARAFIGTLWKPGDKSSANFAVEFYNNLLDGLPIGDALRRTRLAFSKRVKSDEVDWAGFALFGNPDNTLFSPRDRKEMKRYKMEIMMSNDQGTLGTILVALAREGVDLVGVHSITFDEEVVAGCVGQVEISNVINVDKICQNILDRLGSLLIEIRFSEIG